MKISISLSGGDQVARRLAELGDEINKVIEPAVLKGAKIFQDEIEANAPRDTEKLAGQGFTTKVGSKKKNGANAVVTLRQRLYEYAFDQEFGAPNRRRGGSLPARPFIRPAFEAKMNEAERAVQQEVKKALGL